jgi:hypothetical protein
MKLVDKMALFVHTNPFEKNNVFDLREKTHFLKFLFELSSRSVTGKGEFSKICGRF